MEFPKTILLKDGRSLMIEYTRRADAKAVLEHFETAARETANLSFGPGEIGLTEEQEAEILDGYAKNGLDLAIRGSINEEIAVFLVLKRSPRPRLKHGGEFGISVLQKYWGIGAGAAMMDCMIRWAAKNGVRRIELKVRVDNHPAISLYKKFGFKEEGRRLRGLKIGDHFYDEFSMALWVDS